MARGKGTGVTPVRVKELISQAVAKESQYAVAKKSGLALSLVQGLLRGDREPTTSTLNRLSAYFDVPVWELRDDPFQHWWEELSGDLPESAKSFLMRIFFACGDSDGGQVYYDCIKTILDMPDPSCLLKAQTILHEIADECVPQPQPKGSQRERLEKIKTVSAKDI